MYSRTFYGAADFYRDAELLLLGVARVTEPIKTAFGPKGQMFEFHPYPGDTRFTKRGHLIADAVEYNNTIEARGGFVIKAAANRINAFTGDGATTTAILCESMLHEGKRALEAGANPFELQYGVDMAIQAAIRHMWEHTHRQLSRQQMVCIGVSSADGDPEIGTVIAGLLDNVGDRGKITVVEDAGASIRIIEEGVLGVGRSYGVDVNERISRAQTAVHALLATHEEGVIAGGGAGLLHASKALDTLAPANYDQCRGIEIVRGALHAPIRQLAINNKTSGDEVVRVLIKEPNPRFGYDVMSGQYRDMFEAGILDPTKIACTSLEAAGKVASAFVAAPGVLGAGPMRANAFREKNPYLDFWLPESGVSSFSNSDELPDYSAVDGSLSPTASGTVQNPDTLSTTQLPNRSDPGDRGAPAIAETPSRYLVGDFPARVAIGSTKTLNIYISWTAEHGRSAPIELEVPEDGLTLSIFVEASGFEIRGERRAPLFVPQTGESASVGFRLHAIKEGDTFVQISAFNGATLIAGITLQVTISATIEDVPPTSRAVGRPFSSLTRREGDAALYLSFDEEADVYTFFWMDDEVQMQPVRMGKTLTKLNDVLDETVGEIREIVCLDYTVASEVAEHKLKERGKCLWEELIPRDIHERFISFRDKIKRIIVFSDGDPFPWEMLYPYWKHPRFDSGSFLVDQVDLCRWGYGKSNPPATIPVLRADFVVPNENELPKAFQEITNVTGLLKAWNAGLKHQHIQEVNDLYRLFKEALVSLLHFACHNGLDAQKGRILVKNTPICPTDFRSWELAEAAAFIFMNACCSGKRAPGYTSIGGWANCFLGTGVGAFVGTLWEVRDETAQKFAEALYTQLLADKPFGEALRIARSSVRTAAPGDPTWLAYSFYGNTETRMKKTA